MKEHLVVIEETDTGYSAHSPDLAGCVSTGATRQDVERNMRDRRGLLSDVAKAITNTGTDISHADMRTMKGGTHGEFVVEVRDLAHLDP